MNSRGEFGLIVAGVGVTTGALSTDIYTAIIIMVEVTTIITPIWLKKVYQKEMPSSPLENNNQMKKIIRI